MNTCIEVRNFLDDYEWFRNYCDGLDYGGQVNPADGVTYPGISTEIPAGIVSDVVLKAQKAVGKRITSLTMFLRQSVQDVVAPHSVHTDSLMGDYALILHLTRGEFCRGGTSMMRHIATGMDSTPETDELVGVWRRDTNKGEAWEVTQSSMMEPNKAVIIDSKFMHRADPPAGFGSSNVDSRLVLVCFFGVEK